MADEAAPQPVFTPPLKRTSVVRGYCWPAPLKMPTQASCTSPITNVMKALRSASGSGLEASMPWPVASGAEGKVSRLASGAKAAEPPPPSTLKRIAMMTPTTPRPPTPPLNPPGMPPERPVEPRMSCMSPL